MRVGFNPNKDKDLEKSWYIHQVVIPVYIPNQEGYFKDSLKILRRCLESLYLTVHEKTCITVINNGSSNDVKVFLNNLYEANKIQELIHTDNIGKVNAILKGLSGNDIELVTISDADVLFLPHWQKETVTIFNKVPKAGVVGIVPQFKMYEAHCGNVIFDNVLNNKMRFSPVENPEGLKKFYKSIGWKDDYNQDYLKYTLSLKIDSELHTLVGAGHFVATYKKDVFKEVPTYIGYKLGGISELYLDKAPLKKDYWRLTTTNNYAYHMGNVFEEWMNVDFAPINKQDASFQMSYESRKAINKIVYFLKNRLFVKFISIPLLNRLFLRWKGLPKQMIKHY